MNLLWLTSGDLAAVTNLLWLPSGNLAPVMNLLWLTSENLALVMNLLWLTSGDLAGDLSTTYKPGHQASPLLKISFQNYQSWKIQNIKTRKNMSVAVQTSLQNDHSPIKSVTKFFIAKNK
jgi:hypothetical protein